MILNKTHCYYGRLINKNQPEVVLKMEPSESQLCLSWSNTAWIPVLNQQNVLEYFSQKSNPFYDRTCNNEVIKMQRLDSSHLL